MISFVYFQQSIDNYLHRTARNYLHRAARNYLHRAARNYLHRAARNYQTKTSFLKYLESEEQLHQQKCSITGFLENPLLGTFF